MVFEEVSSYHGTRGVTTIRSRGFSKNMIFLKSQKDHRLISPWKLAIGLEELEEL